MNTLRNRNSGATVSFPAFSLAAALVLTAGLCLGLVASNWYAYRSNIATQNRYLRLQQLAGTIRHLNEVLNLSALQAAATGESQWEERYRRLEPGLDLAIREARRMAPGTEIAEQMAQTDAANLKSIEMEHRALEMARQGRRGEARALLGSKEYEQQERIYSERLARFMALVAGQLNADRQSYLAVVRMIIPGALAGLAAAVWTWTRVIHNLRHWRSALQAAINALSASQEALLQNQSELETRVRERTAELSTQILERQNAEMAVRESEQRFRSLFELSRDALMLSDSGRFLDCNEAAVRLFGYSTKEEILGKPPAELWPATQADGQDSLTCWRARLGAVSIAGSQFFECLHQRKDGTVFEAEVSLQRIDLKDQTLIQGVVRDISQRRRAEADRRLLGSAVEQAAESIMIMQAAADPHKSRIVFVNPAFTRIRGCTAAEVLGKPVLSLRGPLFQEEMLRRLRQTLERGDVFRGQAAFCRKDGTQFVLDLTITPIRMAGGGVTHFVAIERDITENKRAEAQLTYERDLLRTLLDHSPDYIYFKDLASRLLKCSRANSARFGLASPEQAVGKTDFDFFDQAHARPAFEDEQTVIRTGHPLIGKVEREVFPDGRIAWALTTKVPLRNPANEIIGTFGISKDITAMKEAEARLAAMQHELLEASRQAGMAEVATGILHNVGNVLNSVNLVSSLVMEKVRNSRVPRLAKAAALLNAHRDDVAGFLTSDPKGQRLPGYLSGVATRLAQEQTEILKDLCSVQDHVEHIKQIVALQQNYAGMAAIPEPASLEQLVEDALQINAAALDRHQVEVVRQYAPCPPVQTEKHKVLQILVNLIRNAKYALDEGRPAEKRLVLRTEATDERARISIQDNGIGIPAENLVRIFEFGFTTRKDGHGFGLHNGALAAQELGGALTAQSAGPGQGALFVLELPCHPTNRARSIPSLWKEIPEFSSLTIRAQSTKASVESSVRPPLSRVPSRRTKVCCSMCRWRAPHACPSSWTRLIRARKDSLWPKLPSATGALMPWLLLMCACRPAGTASRLPPASGRWIRTFKSSFVPLTRTIPGRKW